MPELKKLNLMIQPDIQDMIGFIDVLKMFEEET